MSSRASPDKPKPSVTASAPPPPPTPPPEPFEYYDAGNHWCKNCNVTSGSMFDFFTHLHSKSHRKTQDPYERPWASSPTKTGKSLSSEEKMTKPAKGSEFLLPVRGFFCLLCRDFFGDAICAEEHVTTHAHNEKYKKQMYENPLYEQRRNLDRQAGLTLEASGKKRKHDDEDRGSKEKEEKSKHKKEKKDKEKKKDEGNDLRKDEKSKVKKEEENDKPKPSRKEEDFKPARNKEEERPGFSKKDEDEKYKYSKKDDKNRYSREDEEKAKYSKKDEEDRYKYSKEEEYRHPYHKEDEERFRSGRGDDRPKYSYRDDDGKYKYSKYSDSRFRYDREREEGKPKEPRQYRKPEQSKEEEKPEVKKQPEAPLKPYDPPKVLCGPSPAMRAKLRKQSIETGKAAPTAPLSTFGKFTWKKKENTLAKEAERVAAEFLKDDETSATQENIPVEDSFAKSVAVAKEIAQKLAGQTGLLPTPTWVSPGANRGRIRPNLPAPTAVFRRTTMMGKPAPLNTFLSIRPQYPNTLMPPPTVLSPNLPSQDSPIPPVIPPQESPVIPPSSQTVSDITTKPSEAKPETVQSAPPPMSMIKIVSDVAAPGVPESEQTHTVFVKPPPFMNSGDGAQKSEKLKTNLAAAKAQDLFDIFYSSIGQPGPSAVTRSATDSRAEGNSIKSSQSSKPQPASQPKPQTQTQLQSQNEPQTVPQTQSKPAPQTQPIQTLPAPQTKPIQSDPRPCAQPQPTPVPVKSQVQPSPVPKPELTQTQAAPQAEPPQSTQPSPQVEPQPQSLSQLQNVPQNHTEPSPPKSEQVQTKPEITPQIQVEPRKEPDPPTQSFAEILPSPPDLAAVTMPEMQSAPKTKTKTSPQSKKTPTPPRPIRQTRSQTRYQTRQQQLQLSQPEPESDSVQDEPSEPSALDVSGPGSDDVAGSQSEEMMTGDATSKMDISEETTVTPETLGLPSDMMSLGFEYDFNFE